MRKCECLTLFFWSAELLEHAVFAARLMHRWLGSVPGLPLGLKGRVDID
jgi:hypothetical protein